MSEATKPEVGMGVTYSVGSDCYAGTIVKVSKSGHQIVVQDDKATMVNADGQGIYGQQEYTFEANPNGRTRLFTRRSYNGRYCMAGTNYGWLSLGVRRAYTDPHF